MIVLGHQADYFHSLRLCDRVQKALKLEFNARIIIIILVSNIISSRL